MDCQQPPVLYLESFDQKCTLSFNLIRRLFGFIKDLIFSEFLFSCRLQRNIYSQRLVTLQNKS